MSKFYFTKTFFQKLCTQETEKKTKNNFYISIFISVNEKKDVVQSLLNDWWFWIKKNRNLLHYNSTSSILGDDTMEEFLEDSYSVKDTQLNDKPKKPKQGKLQVILIK